MRLLIPAFLLAGLVSAGQKQKVEIYYDVSVAYTREDLLEDYKFVSTTSKSSDFKRTYDQLSTEIEASFSTEAGTSGSASFAMDQMRDHTISSETESTRTSEDTVIFRPGRHQVYRVVTKRLNIDSDYVTATEKTYVYDYDKEDNDPCQEKTISECHQYWNNLAREYLNANLIPPGETPLAASDYATVRYSQTFEVEAYMPSWNNLGYVEVREWAWEDARNKLIQKLAAYDVGTDQLISIDAHNNGIRKDGIFSAQWNRDLPYGKHISAMRWSSKEITWSSGAWVDQYEQHAQLIRDQVPCGRVISTTGTVNMRGTQVFWTFYVPDEEGKRCQVKLAATHRIEVDYRLTGYRNISTYLKTYEMSSGFKDTATSFKTSASVSGSYSGVSASAKFALSQASQRTSKYYKDQGREQKLKKAFGHGSVQGWITIKTTVQLNGQTVTYTEDMWKESYTDDNMPTFEFCQTLANEYLRDELRVRKIGIHPTNTADRVFDDNIRATVYNSVIHENVDVPKHITSRNIGWFEDRARERNAWVVGGENIKKFLIRENIGTGQIIWIDAHNNGDRGLIMSVFYNKNFPYGDNPKYLNFMLLNHDSSWDSMYRDSNKFLSKNMVTGNRVVSVSGSVNVSGRQVLFTWYTQNHMNPESIKWAEIWGPGRV